MSVRAEVIPFRSAIDGSEQRAGLCGPEGAGEGEALPLLVELEPGSIVNLEQTLETGRRHLELIDAPAVWLRPGGRGPGTVFQGYGEVDVFEAIEAAAQRYSIDRRRIGLYGSSMGGAGTWYLGTHFPDRFAAIAPFAGYNDYRLWQRPGGMTFPLLPWEEASWRARSGAFLLENLRHVGVWIVHGAWDRAVGGGVDVAHARNSAAALRALGIAHRYTELPETGHGVMRAAAETPLLADVLRWLATQRRPAAPERVSFATYELRHPGAYWVEIQQLVRYGGVEGRVDAEATAGAVTVQTANVRHLAIGPAPLAGPQTRLQIDGSVLPGADLRARLGLRRDTAGAWRLADPVPPEGEKRPGLSGPFGDLFRRGTALVTATGGTPEDRFFADWCSVEGERFFRAWNGGVHRGGIPGEQWASLPIERDVDALTTPQRAGALATPGRTRNELAYGTPATNAVLAGATERYGLAFEPDAIRLRGRTWRGNDLALIAVLPAPDGGDRYLAVHGGAAPDAITHGAHLHWGLLPDYLVYGPHQAVDWGFFDNDWRIT